MKEKVTPLEKNIPTGPTSFRKNFLTELKIKNIILLVGFLVALNLMYPTLFPQKIGLKVGDVAERDIIAPSTFYIKKSKAELQEEIKLAKQSVPPVLRKLPDASKNIKQELNNFFKELKNIRTENIPLTDKKAKLTSIVPTLKEKDCTLLLRRKYKIVQDASSKIVDKMLKQGVISYKSIDSPIVTLGESSINKTKFVNYDNILSLIKQEVVGMSKNVTIVNIIAKLAHSFIKPNLILDSKETLKRTKEAINQIQPTKGVVLKNEIIVRAHDKVTESAAEKINSLPQAGTTSRFRLFFGINVMYLIALFTLLLCIYFINPALLKEFNKMVLLLLLLCLVMGISSLIILSKLPLYFIPVAAFGILVSLLLGAQIGIIGVITLTILLATYSAGESELIIFSLFLGILSVFASKNVKKSFDFYKSLAFLSGGCICVALGIEAMKLSPFIPLVKSMGWAALGGITATFFAFALLPLFEHIFKLTTHITLTSYADLDHPLMQTLATYASGTYHHSLTVANLAEAAARAINANPLLARVGAYYHDIGKLKRPNYFIENQRGEDPHAKLKPELNAFIIISHVKEGVALAKKENLPEEIIQIIASHHGTTLVSPFYVKAKDVDEEANELDFRYKGPLPTTKESAIVMLADAVEATARSIDEPTPALLKGVIEDTVKRRVADGQLSKVDLSLDELKKVEYSFLPILMGIFHSRTEYDKSLYKKTKKESASGGSNKPR